MCSLCVVSVSVVSSCVVVPLYVCFVGVSKDSLLLSSVYLVFLGLFFVVVTEPPKFVSRLSASPAPLGALQRSLLASLRKN